MKTSALKETGPHRRGFTAIEVLTATTLASLLMVAVLGVLAGLAKKEKTLDQTRIEPRWHDELVQRLRSDLSCSESITWTHGDLTLQASADCLSPASNWLPVEITYYVANDSENSLVIRSTRSRILPSSANSAEILCIGADMLLLCDYAIGDDAEVVQAVLPAGPIPPRLRVMLIDQGQIVLNREILL